MAKQFCTECGTPLDEGARFCPECGTKVPVESVSASDQSKQQSTQQTETQQPKESKPQSQPYVYAQPSQSSGYYNRGENSGGYQTPPNGVYGNSNYGLQTAPVMSVGSYLLTFFILSIPIVGLIMFLVWAFDKSNPNRRNMLIAQLIWALICTGAAIVLMIIFGSTLVAIFNNFNNYSSYSSFYNY